MISIGLLLFSFVLIWKSADYFVDSSYAIALRFKVSPIVIGATVVAFGTSAPELFVNMFAAVDQQAPIIYGNILGSNLANTMLILGSALLLAPMAIAADFRQQLRINVLFTGIITVLLYNQYVTRLSALLILVFFIGFNMLMFKKRPEEPNVQSSSEESNRRSWVMITGSFFGSLIGLVISAKLLIYSLLQTANFLGLSTVFLSLFAVALGTSLPELVSTIIFIKKGHTDMVVGNVFGSNVFNFMLVLPMSWMVFPLQMPSQLIVELMILLAVLLIIMLISFFREKMSLFTGILLLLSYILYVGFIYFRPI
tara:strand:- start:2196 stop:3128 length:933 start_codon:yes stop_codon:yes gene_type:complete